MTVLSSLIFSLLASVVIAVPTPVEEPRSVATLSVDDIVGFAQTVPSGTEGDLYLAYQPYLYVYNGCVPFPAVNAEGDTNGGLAPTGGTNSGCSSSTGQIYARATTYGDYYAIMYAWYMPKDEPSDGIGHRHDWEGAVVWLTSSTSTTADNIVAVCPSAHGGWDCSSDGYTLSGTYPLIKYESVWPLDHSMWLTTTVGGMQPLIAYESLPALSLTALEDTDFGSAIVPFIDAHFDTNLAACSW